MNSTACSFFLDFLLLLLFSAMLLALSLACISFKLLHLTASFHSESFLGLLSPLFSWISFSLSLSKPPSRYISLTFLFLSFTSLTLLLPIPPHAISTQLCVDIHHICTNREIEVLVHFSAGLSPHPHILRNMVLYIFLWKTWKSLHLLFTPSSSVFNSLDPLPPPT